jgi:hypothetical protein
MGTGSLRAARLWARTDVRSRWRSLVALGLIAGVTAGLALASLAGSMRTSTALHREQDRTNASDAIVFASQVGASHPDWSVLAARPEVRSLSPWALVFGSLDGDPEGLLFAPVDDRWIQSVDAPIVVRGRMFDPATDDEVVIADGAAAQYHISVGDTVPFTPYTPAENESSQNTPDGTDLHGPHLTMRVVGIVRTPMEPLFVSDGLVLVSPGIIRQHSDVDFHENAVIQLVHPGRDLTALEAHVNSDVAPGAPVLDLRNAGRRVTASTDVEGAALALLALAIALAGLVLAGQVVIRSASGIGTDVRVLAAVGMRRTTIAAASTLSHVVAAAIAVGSSIATAVIASRWLPLGQAAKVEPDPGMRLDALVILPGAALVGAVLLGVVFLTGWLAAGRPRPSTGVERRGLADWMRRHASAPVGIGITLALRRGRGTKGLPVRSALAGAAVGVLGVAGALTLDAGLRDALAHPERAGVTWEAQAIPGSEEDYTEQGFVPDFVHAMEDVEADDRAQIDRAVIPIDAAKGVPTWAVRPLGGHRSTTVSLVTLDGRAPAKTGEAAIGPATARILHLGVGDTIEVGEAGRHVRIVGTALFPSEVHSEFDEGLWLVPEDFDNVNRTDGSAERLVAFRFDRGREGAGLAELATAVEPFHGFSAPADQPPELTNLRGVLPLPRLLAGFLALLALAALLYALMSTARMRKGDFAVLRAIGFTRRSTRLVLQVQSAAVFVVGLVLGIPLGLAAGRVGWSLIAERVPLEVVTPLALVATAVLVPAALIIARLTAIGPGFLVSRLRTAEALRSE